GYQEAKRLIFPERSLQHGQGLLAILRQTYLHPPPGKKVIEYAAIGRVVVHHQDRDVLELRIIRASGANLILREGQTRGERDAPPLPLFALPQDRPSHQRRQPSRNRQSESGTAVPAGGRAV